MTKQEFNKLSGLGCSDEMFTRIHAIYMAAGDNIDKETFCKEYKWLYVSKVFNALFDHSELVERKNEEQRKELFGLTESATKFASSMADFLLDRAQAFGDQQLLEKAVELVGYPEVIRRKLQNEMPLWDADMEFIISELKSK